MGETEPLSGPHPLQPHSRTAERNPFHMWFCQTCLLSVRFKLKQCLSNPTHGLFHSSDVLTCQQESCEQTACFECVKLSDLGTFLSQCFTGRFIFIFIFLGRGLMT